MSKPTVIKEGALVTALVTLAILVAPTARAATVTISKFAPRVGPIGTEVTLVGSGFKPVDTVTFHGVADKHFRVVSDTKIVTMFRPAPRPAPSS